MVSDKYKFNEKSADAGAIPLKMEEFGVFAGLSQANSRILSLLTEEMIGMARSIIPEFSAEIQSQNEKNCFEIIMSLNALIKSGERDKLLKVSGGENAAAGKGLLGKIGETFINWAIEQNDNPSVPMMTSPELGMGMGIVNGYEEWSMKTYLDSMSKDDKSENLHDDGLERSIIMNLADDCKMSVKSGSVVMTVTKEFNKD
ncbi:MAG: hypothetical protein LBM87_00540 [Ruminococcus sp.]|jgi:hypothetical protein|nr:hypothetical protein [Ruminococcus sp.]